METSITGIIKSVQLIEVSEIDMKFIYGTVEYDSLGRWEPENWMVSSPIERIDVANLLVYTQNSIYKVDLLPEAILLSYEQLLLVRQGVSPDCI
jgi:hypothetical protein